MCEYCKGGFDDKANLSMGFCKSCSTPGHFPDDICQPCFEKNERAKRNFEAAKQPYIIRTGSGAFSFRLV